MVKLVCSLTFALIILSASIKCQSSFSPFLHAKNAGQPSKYGNKAISERCFCELEGSVNDCECNVAYVDSLNNNKIFPRITSLLTKNYFRFYKVHLFKKCPFWDDNEGKCSLKFCAVEECPADSLPDGLKHSNDTLKSSNRIFFGPLPNEEPCIPSKEDILGSINETISKAASESIATWIEYDAKTSSFCVVDEEPPEDQIYVDLIVNPERYTGYKGPDAHKIWKAIYEENCFNLSSIIFSDFLFLQSSSCEHFICSSLFQDMCFEKRVFYRAVSGLHASINIHLSLKYLYSAAEVPDVLSDGINSLGNWGPNLEEFHRRFDPDRTNGHGPQWLRNLYFLYLLQLRALGKAAPFLENVDCYTGNADEDYETKEAVRDILNIVKDFEYHFNESTMFSGGQQAVKLKDEFRLHFLNVSRIMDCVGCQKCRLWGKLQTQGLGTALKILFSGDFDSPDPTVFDLRSMRRTHFKLTRNEVVALFNALGRLSDSIQALEMFRKLAVS
ncbi:ero1-like protein isoform X3 [Artemia franciscana]